MHLSHGGVEGKWGRVGGSNGSDDGGGMSRVTLCKTKQARTEYLPFSGFFPQPDREDLSFKKKLTWLKWKSKYLLKRIR